MKNFKYTLSIALLASTTLPVFAQSATAAQTSMWDAYPTAILVPILILTVLLTFLIIGLGVTAVEVGAYFRKKMMAEGVKNIPWVFKVFGIFEGDTEALTGTYNDELIEGHEYDGIREFDNDLPPWWVYMFYATIAFAVVYLAVFHVFKIGKLQEEEFQQEMELAELLYADVDEEYEGPSAEAAIIAEGKAIFDNNCVVCHRADLGGNIGPNLTDDCWKFGSNINDIYKTVKYGQEPKMPAWQNSFSNDQIFAISSYVLSMQGTNPVDGKPCEQ